MGNRTKTAVVIGAGPAGMEAALKIGQAGFRAVLIEKEAEMGGNVKQLCSSFPRWEDPRTPGTKSSNCKAARRLKSGKIPSPPQAGRTEIHIRSHFRKSGTGRTEEVTADAVVLATAFELMDISIYGEYGYGVYPDVVTALEFEATLKEWKQGKGNPPKGVALIKCVGSRDRSKGNPYCSKICCMYTAKQAGMVKELFPEAKVYVFYMDYRAAGKQYEEFVREVIDEACPLRSRPSGQGPLRRRQAPESAGGGYTGRASGRGCRRYRGPGRRRRASACNAQTGRNVRRRHGRIRFYRTGSFKSGAGGCQDLFCGRMWICQSRPRLPCSREGPPRPMSSPCSRRSERSHVF